MNRRGSLQFLDFFDDSFAKEACTSIDFRKGPWRFVCQGSLHFLDCLDDSLTYKRQ